MLKKVILHLSGPLVALILMGCSSSNAIDFGVDSQCVYPIKGSMKYIEVSKMDVVSFQSFLSLVMAKPENRSPYKICSRTISIRFVIRVETGVPMKFLWRPTRREKESM